MNRRGRDARPNDTGMRLRFRCNPNKMPDDELKTRVSALLKQTRRDERNRQSLVGRVFTNRIAEARPRDELRGHVATTPRRRNWITRTLVRVSKSIAKPTIDGNG